MIRIALLRYFTFAAAGSGALTTEWIPIPAGYQNWQLVVVVYGFVTAVTPTLQLETSWDRAVVTSIGSAVNLNSTGNNEQDVAIGMGPLVRSRLDSGAGNSVVLLSAYLTGKSLA